MNKFFHFMDLKYKADWRTLFFLMFHFSLLSTIFFGFYFSPILILLLPFSCFIACVIAHNHIHCATFKHKKMNVIFGVILSIAMGQPITGIITAHCVRHHKNNNEEVDFVRCSLIKFSQNWLNLLTFPSISIYTMYKEKKSDLPLWKATNKELYFQAIFERVCFYGLVLFLLMLNWQRTLLFLAIPWILGQMMLIVMNLLQHQDCQINSEFNHSRNIIGSFSNFIFFNNGFHTVHHLHPECHWSLTDKLHEEISEKIDPSLNYQSISEIILERAKLTYPKVTE